MKLLAVIALVGVFSFRANAQAFKFDPGKSKAVIPFKLINNLIFIPIDVNGVTLNFMVDSGIEETIMFGMAESGAVNSENTETMRLRGLGGAEYIECLKSSNNVLRLHGLTAFKQNVYVILDQEFNFSSNVGIAVNGIIGYHFFKDHIIEISYDSKRITVYQTSKKLTRKLKNHFIKIPLSLEFKKPYLMTQIIQNNDTIPAKLLVDTGSSDALWIFNEQSVTLPDKNISDFLGRGFSGDIYGKRARLPKIRIDNFELNSLVAAFPDSASISHIKLVDDRVGSVGGEILRRFRLFFDYRSNCLYIKKGNYFDEPFNYNMSGIELHHDGLQWVQQTVQLNTAKLTSSYDVNGMKLNDFKYKFELKPLFVIFAVRPGSPAEVAGLRKGDLLVSINKADAYRYSLQEINSLLKSEEGRNIEMEVERNSQLLQFSFQLQGLL